MLLAIQNSDYSQTNKFRETEQKALAGDAFEQFQLSEIYRMYLCDDKKSLYWLEKSAQSGYSKAQSHLASFYEHGWNGAQKDLSKALFWHRKAAQQGYAASAQSLGTFYEDGIVVTKDINKAIHWYNKATEGNPSAYYDLAVIYFYGKQVPQDYKKARDLFQKAVDKIDKNDIIAGLGLSLAENKLAEMYLKGYGGEQNYFQAAQLYQSSASKGYKWSQLELGKLYVAGLGVVQDYVQAYMWFNLPSAGSTGAQTYARSYRDKLAQKMTPEQVEEAQTLTRQWTPKR